MVLYDEMGNYLIGGQLPLSTRKGRQIPNDRRAERHPASLRAAKEMFEGNHSTVRARSLTGLYNCMGMVFASRRTWIDTDQLQMILEDDDYRLLSPEEDIVSGDVVVYRDKAASVSHVGLVAQVRHDLMEGTTEVVVLSQWGYDGEYFHRVDDVHPSLGTPTEYWSDRR